MSDPLTPTTLEQALREIEGFKKGMADAYAARDQAWDERDRQRVLREVADRKAAALGDAIRGFNTLLGWNMTNACSGEVECWCDAHRVVRGETPTQPLSPSTLIPGGPPAARGKRATSPELERQAAEIWRYQEELRRVAIPGSRALTATTPRVKRIVKLLQDGVTVEDCRAVLEAVAANCRRDPGQSRWFNGETTWDPKNFDRTLGMIGARAPRTGGVLEALAESVAEAEQRERECTCDPGFDGGRDKCPVHGAGGDR